MDDARRRYRATAPGRSNRLLDFADQRGPGDPSSLGPGKRCLAANWICPAGARISLSDRDAVDAGAGDPSGIDRPIRCGAIATLRLGNLHLGHGWRNDFTALRSKGGVWGVLEWSADW